MRKLLVVEDEELLRDSYRIILSTDPYIVDIASNGQEALDKCATIHYDLILLDLMMPVLDGLGFMEEYSRLPKPTSKILILSNLSTGKELDTALKLGASGSVLKASLSPKQLLSTVRYELQATESPV